ncbi:hypothetical protein AGMMS49944_22290 [Spirochaetia bacterium]|nr:hypothetical protein AGMMS49944_22290 [Spirochaetia bacterium]
MKRIIVGVAVLAMFFAAGLAPLAAQAADRAYYVNTDEGKDDNNGRSAAQAFKTLQKAFESAKATAVKKIILLVPAGTRDTATVGGESVLIKDTGDAEILLTTVDNSNAFSIRIDISGKSRVRLENIKIDGSQLAVAYGTQLTLGGGSEVTNIVNGGQGGGSGATVILESNAKMRPSYDTYRRVWYDRVGLEINDGGKVIIKDHAEITGYKTNGVEIGKVYNRAEDTNELTLQDNAKISDCDGTGIHCERGSIILKGSAVMSGNKGDNYFGGGAIVMTEGTLLMQDNAAITGNTTKNNGGGICLDPTGVSGCHIRVTITGNAVVSGNTAKHGGGIYLAGTGNEFYETDTYYSLLDGFDPREKITKVTIRKNGVSLVLDGTASIKDNTATEGGGIYITNGSVLTEYTGDEVKKTATLTQTVGGFLMKGGTISGNKADYGAGVYVCAENDLTIPEQRGVYGSLYKAQNTGKQISKPGFTFTGGSITGNAAEFVGGGVFVKKSGAYVPGRGTVTNNTAGDGEGENVYNLP